MRAHSRLGTSLQASLEQAQTRGIIRCSDLTDEYATIVTGRFSPFRSASVVVSPLVSRLSWLSPSNTTDTFPLVLFSKILTKIQQEAALSNSLPVDNIKSLLRSTIDSVRPTIVSSRLMPAQEPVSRKTPLMRSAWRLLVESGLLIPADSNHQRFFANCEEQIAPVRLNGSLRFHPPDIELIFELAIPENLCRALVLGT